MRLWHYKMIQFLPKSQLLAQWRELNSIFKKQDKHILINYVYEYPKLDLYHYTEIVIDEMKKRGYKINDKSTKNANNYFKDVEFLYGVGGFNGIPFKNHHNFRYLQQCYFNLEEKYDRGQKDFTTEQFNKLQEFYNKEYLKYLKGGK